MKPKERKSFCDRQDCLLKAAVSVFSEFGLKGSTTREIAKRAGINEALIFRHYPDKESLYRAALDYCGDDKSQRNLDKMQKIARMNLEAGVKAWIRLMREESEAHPEMFRMILFCGLESPELAQNLFKKSHPIMEWMTLFFKKHRDAGLIRKDLKPEACATSLMHLIHHDFLVRHILKCSNLAKLSNEPSMTKIFLKGTMV